MPQEIFLAFFISPLTDGSFQSTSCSYYIKLFAVCLYFDLKKRVHTCQRKYVKWNRGWLTQVEGVRESAMVRRSGEPWCIPSNTRGSILAWPVRTAMGCSWGSVSPMFPRQESSSVPFPLAEDTRGGTAGSCCKLVSCGATRGHEPSRATWLRVLWQLLF